MALEAKLPWAVLELSLYQVEVSSEGSGVLKWHSDVEGANNGFTVVTT